MKQKYQEIIKSVFSISGMIAIVGGFIVFVLFCIALIIGGESGGNLAILAKKEIMPYFIRAATVATMAGLLLAYSTGDHALTLENKKRESKKDELNA